MIKKLMRFKSLERFFKYLKKGLLSVIYNIIINMPDEFTRMRVYFYNKRGCNIHKNTSICSNVRITGKLRMDCGSSIAQNCTISCSKAGVDIGKNVMIAPNVVIVAFNHGYKQHDVPMLFQENEEAPIVIEDNVWISSNCTIGKGVRIGTGAIIAANSFINSDVPAFSIFGGVPGKLIKYR